MLKCDQVNRVFHGPSGGERQIPRGDVEQVFRAAIKVPVRLFPVVGHALQRHFVEHLLSSDELTVQRETKMRAFAGFQVNAALMACAKKSAIFLHCLPAHRGEEVAAEVIDGPQSVVWDEAENRMHGQKALIEYLLLGQLND